ncbi:MAG: efflux RND transporter periplasmic adaptor subunit [Gemmataceae bacterium]
MFADTILQTSRSSEIIVVETMETGRDRMRRLFILAATVLGIVGLSVAGYLIYLKSPALQEKAQRVIRGSGKARVVRVEVTHPVLGVLEKVATHPGSVHAYETVELFAEASGYLKRQNVDLGDLVKKGAVLAEVDVPDLEKAVQRARAVLEQSRAQVTQAKAALLRVKAEILAARAAIPQAEANLQSASANRKYRERQHRRMIDLHQKGGLEERLVDESEERRQAALAGEKAAAAAIETAQAQYAAAQAKLSQAEADIAETGARVQVAQADLDRAEVHVHFAKVVAPFDGVITRRNLSPGGFVRSAKEGERTPLLALDRLDRVRVVVQVPDREAPFTNKGDQVKLEMDALDGKTFVGQVARTQVSQDVQTRTMRTEIDLDNPGSLLRPGMFGKVTITLEKQARGLSLPSGCLVGDTREGQGAVYCAREGKAVLVPVRIGMDTGVRVEILSGLSPEDQVVRRFSGSLTPGAPVEVTLVK